MKPLAGAVGGQLPQLLDLFLNGMVLIRSVGVCVCVAWMAGLLIASQVVVAALGPLGELTALSWNA